MPLTWNEAANRWEGDDDALTGLVVATYAELPDPTTVDSGTRAVVTSDPVDGLNGPHIALGGAPTQPARWWRGG